MGKIEISYKQAVSILTEAKGFVESYVITL